MSTDTNQITRAVAAMKRDQLAKLRRYLADTVLPFSAHYKKLGIDPGALRTFDDLRKIPFTSKADIQNASLDFILIPDRKTLSRRPSTILRALLHGKSAVQEGFEREFRPIMMTSTTGRSSEPVPFVYTDHDIGILKACGKRMMQIAGANREMRFVNMFPYAPHLAFWLTHYAGTEFGAFMISTGGGKVMGTDGNLRVIGKVRPDVLVAMPTFAYHVLQEAVTMGVKCPNLRKIVLGGEKVPGGMRTKLIALAKEIGAEKVDVVSTYGFTESKMAWVECACPDGGSGSGYHLPPELCLVEIVDPKTGEPVGEGKPGEIVFTPLDARGSVVLRYRTGDCIDGGLVYDKCPHCGRIGPRLVGNIGRNSEIREMRIDKIKGTLVDFNRLEHALDDYPGVGAWQIELRKVNDDPLDLDEMILHIQKTDTADDESKLREKIGEYLGRELEVHPNLIFFHDSDSMRRIQGVGSQLKELRFVDRRPKAAPSAVKPPEARVAPPPFPEPEKG